MSISKNKEIKNRNVVSIIYNEIFGKERNNTTNKKISNSLSLKDKSFRKNTVDGYANNGTLEYLILSDKKMEDIDEKTKQDIKNIMNKINKERLREIPTEEENQQFLTSCANLKRFLENKYSAEEKQKSEYKALCYVVKLT